MYIIIHMFIEEERRGSLMVKNGNNIKITGEYITLGQLLKFVTKIQDLNGELQQFQLSMVYNLKHSLETSLLVLVPIHNT